MTARRPAIGFIFVTLFLDILGIGLIIPVLPKLIEQFSGGNVSAAASTLGLLVAIYSLMQFVCAPIVGSLSDRFGRRPILLASLFGYWLDYLLLTFAPSLGWFFLGRVLAGVTGASISTATAYVADVTPPEKRAQSFGLIGAAFGLGFIAGPAMGGWLGDIGLRLPFLTAAGLTLVNWFYGLLVLPESLPLDKRRPFSWSRANPVGSLIGLKRYPVVLGLTGTLFLLYLAQNAIHSTWVLYTGYRYHWNSAQTGLSLAIVGLAAAIVQGGLIRVIVPKLGERRAIVVGLSISTVNLIGYGIATEGWMIYAILAVGSFGAIGGPTLQGLISRSVPVDEQGSLQGALASLTSLAGIIGPPIAANLFGYFISPRAPWTMPGAAFFCAAAMIAAAIAWALRTFHRHPPEPVALPCSVTCP